MRLGTLLLCAGAVLAFTAVNAATTYDGNGQVPAQFVLTGKAADRDRATDGRPFCIFRGPFGLTTCSDNPAWPNDATDRHGPI